MAGRACSTQTEVGRLVGLSAREVGAHLTAAGLKDGSRATERALEGKRSGQTLAPATDTALARGYARVVATDGSALRNPGPTVWAWVDQTTGETGSGGLAHGTNNSGELLALLRALRHAGPDGDVLVRSDSTYVINVARRWAPGWRRRGWRKADGTEPENIGIVQEIATEMEARAGRTDLEWVRGHAGDRDNEQADARAVAAARAAAR